MTRKYISCVETAKLIRKALKENFSGVKFSVRSDQYAGGASINVEWTDGPTKAEVEKVVKFFAGASFDGMTDCKNYHTRQFNGEEVHFGADYVFTRRNITEDYYNDATQSIWGQGIDKVSFQEYKSGAFWNRPEWIQRSIQEGLEGA